MKTERTPDEVFADKQKAMSNEALIGFATDEINDLAKSYGKSHRMSIPPQITDTDMLLSELVRRFEYASSQSPEPNMVDDPFYKEAVYLVKRYIPSDAIAKESILEWLEQREPNTVTEGLNRELRTNLLLAQKYIKEERPFSAEQLIINCLNLLEQEDGQRQAVAEVTEQEVINLLTDKDWGFGFVPSGALRIKYVKSIAQAIISLIKEKQ